MLSLITLFLPSEHDRFVAVVAVIVDDIVAGRVGKTLPSGNVGNQDLCSSSSFIFTTDSSWILAKKLIHLLHASRVGILFEMFAQRDVEKHDRPRHRLR